ncbi:hypothetical protein L596_026046 [Steinernema carpocapsae]|uniref:Uncharacterized protein n=1 Tax=Steinernema carpocapsae TaxID=34508 RepID=A0A4U5M167_STECR|nr:hypothetical protein L596_026046 [Steinernema carpocapsae]
MVLALFFGEIRRFLRGRVHVNREQVKNAAYIPPEDGQEFAEFAEDSLDETDQENEESEYEDDISTGDISASSGFANYNEKDMETK